MNYLLDVGYNPNIFNGLDSLPAILHAFKIGCLDSVSQLISRGAEIDSSTINPSSLFETKPCRTYHQRLNILTSVGFSDWKVENRRSLLHGALAAGDWRGFLFALEIVGLKPQIDEVLGGIPLVDIVINNRMAMAAALIECGADVNRGNKGFSEPVIFITISRQRDAMTHFLLYCGVKTDFTDCHLVTPWYEAWRSLIHTLRFKFSQSELLLTHLLLHGANPFETGQWGHFDSVCGPATYNYTNEWQMKSPEFARAWSFSSCLGEKWLFNPSQRRSLERSYEAFEIDRMPRMTIRWSENGLIMRAELVCSENWDTDKERDVFEDGDDDESYESDDDEYHDEDNNIERDDNDDEDYEHDMSEHGQNSGTLFYETISTAEGRQRMSTFPAVQLRFNALSRAGYRAEVDAEGDIWFEDDDGDMYYAAREFQSELGDSGPKVDCYICRDLRKYGLGEILDQIELGKRRLYSYREEVKASKRKWCL
ncbi:hypothetical protein F4824DRAFT_507553 [Ustulina deusta]|nr:hypothetical protein F4824DRAFT_507553 [Ustulina deusta]